jgi:hypothetical protein
MARGAYYGHIQPSEFLALEWKLGIALVSKVQELHFEELKILEERKDDRTKVMIQATGATIRA